MNEMIDFTLYNIEEFLIYSKFSHSDLLDMLEYCYIDEYYNISNDLIYLKIFELDNYYVIFECSLNYDSFHFINMNTNIKKVELLAEHLVKFIPNC